ncbi:MAG: class I SAM-dependent methyltransferase [Candidatus Acidiferrum sp.]
MNAAEHFICSSSLWRHLTGRKLLPWILTGASLGDHLLEIGAGYGPATAHLQTRVPRITSLDYDHNASLQLKSQNNADTIAAVQGDASQLPFACRTFSSALAILVLHHLKSTELQDQMFAEAFRVLRPGGVFIVFEIPDNWLHRVGHIRSTFTPMVPGSVFPRLNTAGFSEISLDVRSGGFRFTAIRPTTAPDMGNELA